MHITADQLPLPRLYSATARARRRKWLSGAILNTHLYLLPLTNKMIATSRACERSGSGARAVNGAQRAERARKSDERERGL